MNGSGVEEVESSLVLGHAKLVENDLRQEKSRTLGVRAWEIFGFGTQYLWLFSIMFGSAFFSLSGDVEWARFVKAVFALGFAVVYLVFFALKNVVDFGSMGRVSIVLFGVVGSLGTMLVVFPCFESIHCVCCIRACWHFTGLAYVARESSVVEDAPRTRYGASCG